VAVQSRCSRSRRKGSRFGGQGKRVSRRPLGCNPARRSAELNCLFRRQFFPESKGRGGRPRRPPCHPGKISCTLLMTSDVPLGRHPHRSILTTLGELKRGASCAASPGPTSRRIPHNCPNAPRLSFVAYECYWRSDAPETPSNLVAVLDFVAGETVEAPETPRLARVPDVPRMNPRQRKQKKRQQTRLSTRWGRGTGTLPSSMSSAFAICARKADISPLSLNPERRIEG